MERYVGSLKKEGIFREAERLATRSCLTLSEAAEIIRAQRRSKINRDVKQLIEYSLGRLVASYMFQPGVDHDWLERALTQTREWLDKFDVEPEATERNQRK